MSPERYRNILKKYVETYFTTQKEAAEAFGCSQTTMTLVLMLERKPNKAMLKATGHKYQETIISKYVKA